MMKDDLDTAEYPPSNLFDSVSDHDEDRVTSPYVSVKYRGTQADKNDMLVLGKKQVLRRNFNFLTMLGFSSTVRTAWEVLPIVSVFALENGGLPIILWGGIIGAIGLAFVYASLAEVASMCPTAGGQYHWVSELAPPRFQKGLSYSVGWLVSLAWQLYLASVCFMISGVVQGLISFNAEGYVSQPWHASLIAIAVVSFAIFFNTVLAARLPFIQGMFSLLHTAGAIGLNIPLWVLAPRGNAKGTLLVFTKNGGWPTPGLAAMIGTTTIVGTLAGYDCSVHMSEEVKNAAQTVPRTLLWSFLLNCSMFIFMGATFIRCVGDLRTVTSLTTGQPFIQVFYNTTQSYTATNSMVAVILVLLMSAAIGEVTTASRQLWSFARDRGAPGSYFLSKVSPEWKIPLRAVGVCFLVTILLSLINLGSTEALTAITSLGGTSILFSYFVTISCLVWRRLCGTPLPPRPWSLGRYGLLINIVALIFVVPILFFYVWPLTVPATTQNMNWAVFVFSAVLSSAAVYYFVKAKHIYTGPVMLVKRK